MRLQGTWASLGVDDRLKIVGLVVTIVLAFAGYFFTWWHNRATAKRKDRLERVNRQLKELFGPFSALLYASNKAWHSFRGMYRPGGGFWGVDPPPTPEEAAAWRLWMREVFHPLNVRMETLVLENADLLDEDFPRCFLDLCAHVATYRTVLKRWDEGDYSEHTSVNNFPAMELRAFIDPRCRALREEQRKLLGAHARADRLLYDSAGEISLEEEVRSAIGLASVPSFRPPSPAPLMPAKPGSDPA